MPSPFVELELGGRTVKVTNPDKVYFPARGETKLDLVNYFVAVGDGIVRALYERPCQLKRQPEGVGGEVIWQKRVPEKRPEWIEFAREIERRVPDLVTTAWWKEERGEKVFVDYNQNARDRTILSAYSVRGRPDATVSAPVRWDELPDVEMEDFTIATMPARFSQLG